MIPKIKVTTAAVAVAFFQNIPKINTQRIGGAK